MRWWLRAHASAGVVLWAGALTVGLALAGGWSFGVPSLFGDGMPVSAPLFAFLPLLLTVVTARNLTRSRTHLDLMAVRRIGPLDSAYGIGPAALVLLAASVSDAGAGVLGGGRNAVGYAGLLLIARALLDPAAAACVPVSYALVAAAAGGGPTGIRWWAFPVADATDQHAWVLAVLLAVAGGVTAAFVPSRLPPQE